MAVSLENISKRFSGTTVLDNISLSFEEGRVSCLMGPSGCGKTTLLNIIAGIIAPDEGTVRGTQGHTMAYAFQEARLLPWKTAVQNVELAVDEKIDAGLRRKKAMECLETVEMNEYANTYPGELSGGMAQRVALARALAKDADILLLDEALSATDTALKEKIIGRLETIWKKRGTTTICVTHSLEEAQAMSARIVEL